MKKCRALGRKLLGEFSIKEDEATSPRRRCQSEMLDRPPVAVGLRETVDTYADCVWVQGEDGQPLPAGSIVESPQRGHVVHGRLLDPISESLLELAHVDAVGSFAHRLRSRGRPRMVHLPRLHSSMAPESMTAAQLRRGRRCALRGLLGRLANHGILDFLEVRAVDTDSQHKHRRPFPMSC